MDLIAVTKATVSFVASASVGTVVGNAIKQTTPENAKIIQKIGVGVGAFVLAGIAGDFAGRYVEEQFDEGLRIFTRAKKTHVLVVQEGEADSSENAEA